MTQNNAAFYSSRIANISFWKYVTLNLGCVRAAQSALSFSVTKQI